MRPSGIRVAQSGRKAVPPTPYIWRRTPSPRPRRSPPAGGPDAGPHAARRPRNAVARSGLWAAVRAFRRGQRGAAPTGAALAIAIVVGAFGGLMEIIQSSYDADRMGRAARAVARAVAFDANAAPCPAIRRELHLAPDFDCASAWTIVVDHGVGPEALPATLGAPVRAGTGELVLVRIFWTRPLWSFIDLVPEANAAGGDDDDGASPERGPLTRVAIGLARCEPTG